MVFSNASVCGLPIGCFLEKIESCWQLLSREFFGTARFENFRRCLIPAYIRILITPTLFCWVYVILVVQITKYGINLWKSTTSSNE